MIYSSFTLLTHSNIAISLTRIHFNPGIKPDTSKMRKLLQIFDQILIDKMLHF